MSEQKDRPDVQQNRESTYYSEQETIEYSRLEIQAIHHLCDAGIINGTEEIERERRYRAEDLLLLRRARRLHQDLGVNLEGIEIIVRLTDRIEALQRELAQYQRIFAQAREKKMGENTSRPEPSG
ncbi:MAG TPA: chaperone modulator CbpM [Ktedonobacteraceae bacterium]|jgi:MerR family transcriptional regulator/heat shock protein HspR|nr:chaperone modulator CbpM [Ktedonobacteraceae bacterium]